MANEALRLQRATRKFRDALAPFIDPIIGDRALTLEAVNEELKETGFVLTDGVLKAGPHDCNYCGHHRNYHAMGSGMCNHRQNCACATFESRPVPPSGGVPDPLPDVLPEGTISHPEPLDGRRYDVSGYVRRGRYIYECPRTKAVLAVSQVDFSRRSACVPGTAHEHGPDCEIRPPSRPNPPPAPITGNDGTGGQQAGSEELHFCDYTTGPFICEGDRCNGHTVKEMEAYDGADRSWCSVCGSYWDGEWHASKHGARYPDIQRDRQEQAATIRELKSKLAAATRERDEFRDSAEGEHALNEQLIREGEGLKSKLAAAEQRMRTMEDQGAAVADQYERLEKKQKETAGKLAAAEAAYASMTESHRSAMESVELCTRETREAEQRAEKAEARVAAWRTVVIWACIEQTTPAERALQIEHFASQIPAEHRPVKP